MAMTDAQKYVGQFAGYLGFFQGIAWFVISAFCLKLYGEGLAMSIESYMDVWHYLVYNQFFVGDNNQVLSPGHFRIIAGIYLVLSGIWAIISLSQLAAISRNSVKIPSLLKNWGSLTWLICIFDIIVSGMLFVDFMKCKDVNYYILNLNIMQEGICTTIYIPVLTIVARGFVLLIVNVVFAILTNRIGKNLAMKAKKTFQVRLVTAQTASPTSQSGLPAAQNREPIRNIHPAASDGINYNNNAPTSPNPYPYRYPYPRNPLPQNSTGQNTGGGYYEMNPVANRNNPATNQQYQEGRY